MTASKNKTRSSIDIWHSLSDADRDTLSLDLSIGEVVDTSEQPPVVAVSVGKYYAFVTPWKPIPAHRALFSSVMRSARVQGRWWNGDKEKLPKKWPAHVDFACWLVPNGAAELARNGLKAEGFKVGERTLADYEETLEELYDAAPKTLKRLWVRGTSSRGETAIPEVDAAEVALESDF